MTQNLHTPVMLERCVRLLDSDAAQHGGIIIDATMGLGGHSEALLQQLLNVVVAGIDRDADALGRASARLAVFQERFFAAHAVYDEIPEVLARVRKVHGSRLPLVGVLFDLGVSSMQLDFTERGFAYAKDAPLDMRMDQSSGKTAAQLLAELETHELADIFRNYGDEPLAGRYAAAIVKQRETTQITGSAELVEILQQATPAKLKNQRHPAKRVFQALRVAVNDELAVLRRAIPVAMDALTLGGRIVSMAYQSHEDKIVKAEFARRAQDRTPPGLPQQLPEYAPEFRLLTRGAEQASLEEQKNNPRSIPVRLRAAEKVRSK